MKKFLSILLLTSLLLSPAASLMEDEPLKIVTLNFAAFDFSRQVAGEGAQVSLLLPPGVDAHSYEPTPKELISLQDADLLVYNGGIGDYWVRNLIASLGDKAPATLVMMEMVDTVTEELVEGMEDVPHAHAHEETGADHHDDEDEHADHDHEDGDEHADHDHEEGDEHADHDHEETRELDEHVWTSPKNAAIIAEAIADKLAELDPANRETYETNYLKYKEQLDALDADFRTMIEAAPRKTIVLGDRFPMRYFTNEYGLSYYAAFPGCSAQTEPSARTIAFLMDTIKEEEVPAVFYIEFSSQKAARLIAGETGAQALLLHSAHNVSQEELDSGVSYLSIMRNNLENLRKALN